MIVPSSNIQLRLPQALNSTSTAIWSNRSYGIDATAIGHNAIVDHTLHSPIVEHDLDAFGKLLPV